MNSAESVTSMPAGWDESAARLGALRAIRRLDYTVIFARDLPAMLRFYRDTMGFRLQRELGGAWFELEVGDSILALTKRGVLFDDPPPPDGAASLQLAFRVSRPEVDACAEALWSAGVALLDGPVDQAWGHRTVFFRDPDGNILEIYADI